MAIVTEKKYVQNSKFEPYIDVEYFEIVGKAPYVQIFERIPKPKK